MNLGGPKGFIDDMGLEVNYDEWKGLNLWRKG